MRNNPGETSGPIGSWARITALLGTVLAAACGGDRPYAGMTNDCAAEVAIDVFGPGANPDSIPATTENCHRAEALPDYMAACLDDSKDPRFPHRDDTRLDDCQTLGVPHARPTEQDFLGRACARGDVVTLLCGQGGGRGSRVTFTFTPEETPTE